MRGEKTNQKSRSTRRTFLKSTGALAAGLSAATVSTTSAAKTEALALNGGPKAVTYPADDHREASRWPLYGPEEEQAILELMRSPSYSPIALLEKDWQEFTGSNYVKAHCNGTGVAQVRSLNDRILQLPGLYEQTSGRTDMERLNYTKNMLFIDENEAGMSRAACVKALQAEGVRAGAYSYRLQHQCTLYEEANWWHHKPVIPELPGCEQANATAISLPYFTSDVPALVEQYAKAFEKVWAHRKELG